MVLSEPRRCAGIVRLGAHYNRDPLETSCRYPKDGRGAAMVADDPQHAELGNECARPL